MAKKSMIARERKREKMVEQYAAKRAALKEAFDKEKDPVAKLEIHRKIQQLPRNSARVRVHNRCWMTGRPHSVYRDFGLSRHALREMAHEGLLPGVVKSSW
jgi:small subunit ribosomal protein S14